VSGEATTAAASVTPAAAVNGAAVLGAGGETPPKPLTAADVQAIVAAETAKLRKDHASELAGLRRKMTGLLGGETEEPAKPAAAGLTKEDLALERKLGRAEALLSAEQQAELDEIAADMTTAQRIRLATHMAKGTKAETASPAEQSRGATPEATRVSRAQASANPANGAQLPRTVKEFMALSPEGKAAVRRNPNFDSTQLL
jgi:hypothetical protein